MRSGVMSVLISVLYVLCVAFVVVFCLLLWLVMIVGVFGSVSSGVCRFSSMRACKSISTCRLVLASLTMMS